MDDDALDVLMRRRDTTMIVVTAAADGERAGCLVGFHAQCSITPLRYAIWLSKANHTCRVAFRATHFGIHFLGRADRELAEVFGTLTGDDTDKFARCAHRDGPHGVPLLDACADRMVVRRTAFLEEGSDHICFVTEPVEATAAPSGEPLRFRDVEDLEPGHPAEDHP
jgi:flavin reductase (DIM6/NTAB) family NADH-FMN oxidoreductase RutF